MTFAFVQLPDWLAAQQSGPGSPANVKRAWPGAEQHPGTANEPGAGPQLETGTTSGISKEARMQSLLVNHEFRSIEAQLGQLAPDQAEFYRGILANRSNQLPESIKLLDPLMDAITKSGNVAQEKELRTALAEDYLRLGEWKKAAEAYQALESNLKNKLTQDEQDDIEMPLKLLPLAVGDPAQTIDPCDLFEVQVNNDPLGLVDVPVFVDARARQWMLDPTLPFNLISRSTAREVGLKLSSASATINTLTGRPIAMYAAVIPRITIGGRLTVRNMTVFVFDDKDYHFAKTGYQVEGVLGYPALAAMGSLTVTSDNTIMVRPAKQISPPATDDLLTTGARFYLDGDQVIVGLGKMDGGGSNSDEERMYEVDAGGQQTYLTSRYFDEHAADFNNQKMEMFSFPGMQSAEPAYVAQDVPLLVGATKMMLHFIHVLRAPLGSIGLDDVYGVLGADALGQLKSYTFDYRTMRFAVTTE